MKRIAETEGSALQREAKNNFALDKRQRRDFLSRFQEAHKKDPEFIPQERVLALTVASKQFPCINMLDVF